jgi:peptidoglycan/LPS O-acetylase OafA/YrhL
MAPVYQLAGGRLAYLDGLRALAALCVVVLHAFQIHGLGLTWLEAANPRGGLGTGGVDRAILGAYQAAYWGFLAVQVFIVISGYSLMLRVAGAPPGASADSPLAFLRRRARRILPPYYAVLALSLLLIAAVPGLNTKADVYWDSALPAWEPHAIVSHLLLLHHAEGYWHSFQRINPPLWTIGVEWQIYFLFPILVLVWRRWGTGALLAAGVGYGTLAVYLPRPTYPLSYTWFVGLFALGMVGASVARSRRPGVARWRARLPWGRLSLLAAAALPPWLVLQRWVLAGEGGPWLRKLALNSWSRDYLVGVAVVCLLLACSERGDAGGERPRLLRALEAPWLVGIGRFSYSLYLTHALTLATLALACRRLGLSPTAAHLAVLALGIPAALLAAYAFFLACERPFLSARRADQARSRGARPQPAGTPTAATSGTGE